MAKTQGTRLIAAIVPADDTDSYPTHKAEWGKGGLAHVQSEADLANLSDQRLTEYQLATVAGRDGLLFQLTDKAAGTWSAVSFDGKFKVVETGPNRDAIPSDQRTDGMIVAVRDVDDDGTDEYTFYQLRGGTTDSDWQEVRILTPSELSNAISSNSDVSANTADRHSHSNKSVLDQITGSGRGSIITATEAGKLHEHSNKAVLDAINNAGRGDVITAAEAGDIHTHPNKNVLDSITSAGSGSIITPSERTDLGNNTSARHTHSNKSVLDAIGNSGSGSVITSTERDLITPARLTKSSDFTVSSGDYSTMYYADTTVNSQQIVATFPDDVSAFPNMWHCYFVLIGGYSLKFAAASGASIRSPGSLKKIVEEYSMASAFHFDEGGNSTWYIEGRLA